MRRILGLLAFVSACSTDGTPGDAPEMASGSGPSLAPTNVSGNGGAPISVGPAAPSTASSSQADGGESSGGGSGTGPRPSVGPQAGGAGPVGPDGSTDGAESGGSSGLGNEDPPPDVSATGEPEVGGAGGEGGVGEPNTAGSGGTAGAQEPGTAGAGGVGDPPMGVPCSPVPTNSPNLFSTLLGEGQEDVDAKVEDAFNQLFHGGNNETVYYESGNEGYILDIASNDIRSEGQSYGMMIAVQLDKKQEFDNIWRWSQRVMQHDSGLFGWHATTSGQLLSDGSAPDGEEYFATALIFASHRWGDETGIDYMSEARRVLGAMYDENLFDHDEQLVKFIAQANYTDPSYILPSFYEVWACVDDDQERAGFWKAAAETGRAFFPKTVHPNTGLAPYLANYDGSARDDFNSDSYRVVGNIMMDHYLYNVDPWQVTFAETYAAFFEQNQQSAMPGAEFRLDGTPTVSYGQPEAGLAAQNAMVAFAAPEEQGRYFVQYLWDMNIPTGQYRYYGGMLYMLALLHVSGHFHVHL